MRMSRIMCLCGNGNTAMAFSFSGEAVLDGDPAGDWKLTLKTGGTLIFNKLNTLVDIFAVGGGAAGAKTSNNSVTGYGGNGGSGGKTALETNKYLSSGTSYSVTIGAGSGSNTGTRTGGASKIMDGETTIINAGGGSSSGWYNGANSGSDGSGGGAGGVSEGSSAGYKGGTDGSNGSGGKTQQTGMGTSGYLVREFRQSGLF